MEIIQKLILGSNLGKVRELLIKQFFRESPRYTVKKHMERSVELIKEKENEFRVILLCNQRKFQMFWHKSWEIREKSGTDKKPANDLTREFYDAI